MLKALTHPLVGWQMRHTSGATGYVKAVDFMPGRGQVIQFTGCAQWYALDNCKLTGRYKAPDQAGVPNATPDKVQAVLAAQKQCAGHNSTLPPSVLASTLGNGGTLPGSFVAQREQALMQWVPGHYARGTKRYIPGRWVRMYPFGRPGAKPQLPPGPNCVVG